MKELLNSLLASKHTSAAGLIVAICALGEIWLPKYQTQFQQTRAFATSYGLLMGGTAIQQAVKTSKTEPLTTPPEPATVKP